LTRGPLPVTYDINVLIEAVVKGTSTFWAWPSPPPAGPFAAAECIGIINDAREFSLWLSPHVIRNLIRVLIDPHGLQWDIARAEEYAALLVELAEASGGQVIDPPVHVADCPDCEDNRILELALASGSVLIVSRDFHLLEMSPWRGTPVISPEEFVGRVDAMRRAARRS
jgi:predicted nucleic acid-binding protein